jgi:flavin reductase (DIM6/NTAB) family NADH-FMN oxidoreductase RutF
MSEQIARLFRTLSSGVYVVGAAHRGKHNAFTAAWVSQVSFEPLLLALSVNTSNASWSLIRQARAFSVNVLGQGQKDIARHFGTRSGREQDKLTAYPWRAGKSGAPILENALSYLECRLEFTRRAGDHVLVVGRVIDGALLNAHAIPMLYAETGDMDGSSALYPQQF